jgi:hypothetical protein
LDKAGIFMGILNLLEAAVPESTYMTDSGHSLRGWRATKAERLPVREILNMTGKAISPASEEEEGVVAGEDFCASLVRIVAGNL